MKKHFFILTTLVLTTFGCCQKKPAETPDRIAQRDAILKNIIPPTIPSQTISVLDFGAKGNSATDCKPAFDAAMKQAADLGGARIIVPEGVYMIEGPIHFVSNVCLDLQEGAHLKFSNNPESYLPVVLTSWEGTFLYNYSPFVYGYQLENISIIGKGTIDGNAKGTFSTWKGIQKESQMLSRDMNHNKTPMEERIFGAGHFLRPHLIQFFECKNILIEDVFITNSPFWCIHLLKSENITIRGISYDAMLANNDGIDPEYSKNILIENVTFNNGDDNVAIKSGRDNEGRETAIPTENIIIRNCIFKGLHAVVIGSEMSAGVRNIFVEDCTFGGYCKRGIYMKSNPDRGGFMKNIYVNNVTLDEVEDAFYITSFYHNEGAEAGHATDISDIYIENFKCRKATNAGIVIQGFPLKKVKDIHFTNVTIDSAAIAINMTNTENIVMNDVTIGGVADVPSTAATNKDGVAEKL